MSRSSLVGVAFVAGVALGFGFAAQPPRPVPPPAPAPTDPVPLPLTVPVRTGDRVVVTEPGPLRGRIGTIERAYHTSNRHLIDIDGTGYDVPDAGVVPLAP